MNNSPGYWDSFINSGFDFKLFLLVVLLSIWGGALLKNKEQSSRAMQILGELLIGLLIGLGIGVLWNMHFYPGITTLSAITLAVMSILNTKPSNRLVRLIAILVATAMALYVYYSYWGDLGYLKDSFMEDFQGGI